MRYYFFILFFVFFSGCGGKEPEPESKAPVEYEDVPIKFVYLNVKDSRTSFWVNRIKYCYEALVEFKTFPLKNLKVEVYDKEGHLLDDSILAKSFAWPESFFEIFYFFDLIIPYQENMKTVKVFRLDKEGNKLPRWYKRSDYPEIHKEELENCEENYQSSKEYCIKQNEEEREGCEKRNEEYREKCRNEEVWNTPLEESLSIDRYKTLDYHENSKCHTQNYMNVEG